MNKIEAIEAAIEYLRPWRSDPDRREVYTLLAAIAKDYRARDPVKIGRTLRMMEHAVEVANLKKDAAGQFDRGSLDQIGLLVIGSWAVWRQAIERFEQEMSP
jgi:hypothetical protein